MYIYICCIYYIYVYVYIYIYSYIYIYKHKQTHRHKHKHIYTSKQSGAISQLYSDEMIKNKNILVTLIIFLSQLKTLMKSFLQKIQTCKAVIT